MNVHKHIYTRIHSPINHNYSPTQVTAPSPMANPNINIKMATTQMMPCTCDPRESPHHNVNVMIIIIKNII